jgi:peptidoglycan/xylan/chitin deacetylase (PgdA/CDA1 family)
MIFFFGKTESRMKKRGLIPALVLSFLVVSPLFGISFRGLDLSGDTLLFRTDFESHHALFVSRLNGLTLQQVTAFPEKLELVDNGRTVLVRSRLGAVTIPVSGGLPVPLPGVPSFAAGSTPPEGRPQEFAFSADGRWILYVEPLGPAYGNLLLIEAESGKKQIISEKIELPAMDFPARWCPDSRLFVYSKGGKLYYFPIFNDPAIAADERFRLIGDGGINAVLWGRDGDFYYFLKNTLYRILNPEFLTRSIYGDFLSIGRIAGTLPLDFDSDFDRYWLAPDSGSVLINKNGKSLFFFLLGKTQNNSFTLPHIMIPQDAGNLNVLWSASGLITITSSLSERTVVWRFETDGRSFRAVTTREVPAASGGALSPDETSAVFWGRTGLELWDYVNWRPIQTLSREPVFSCVWIDNVRFIAGSGRLIEEIIVSGRSSPRRRLICLSNADEFGFEEGRSPSRILARAGAEWFTSDGRIPWTPVTAPRLREVSLSSENYRVYLEPQPMGPYTNLPMIRNSVSLRTVSIVSSHSTGSAYPPYNEKIPVALCFDLYDDDTGLSLVIDALRRFNVKATFFLNGDFIRRNPLAAVSIVEAGHEAASLFYAPINLLDSRFRVNSDYIAQGLARNEDEFFRATGKELNLLWHPPFYRSSDLINRAASASGYITVAGDVDCGDWLTKEDVLRLGIRQYSASDMIERIIKGKKKGAVIPLRLGLVQGGRDDYLFNRIDVLLDALIRSGCEVVPVSAVLGK